MADHMGLDLSTEKVFTVYCLFCLSSHCTQIYLLKGRKCRNEGIPALLHWLIGKDTYDALIASADTAVSYTSGGDHTVSVRSGTKGPSICRTCLNKLKRANEFRTDTLACISAFLEWRKCRTKNESTRKPTVKSTTTDEGTCSPSRVSSGIKVESPETPHQDSINRPTAVIPETPLEFEEKMSANDSDSDLEIPLDVKRKGCHGVRGKRSVLKEHLTQPVSPKQEPYSTGVYTKCVSDGWMSKVAMTACMQQLESDGEDEESLFQQKRKGSLRRTPRKTKKVSYKSGPNSSDVSVTLSSESDDDVLITGGTVRDRSPTPPPDCTTTRSRHLPKRKPRVNRDLSKALTNLDNLQSYIKEKQNTSLNTSLDDSTVVMEADEERHLMVKIRSRSGIQRFDMKYGDSFRTVISEMAAHEAVPLDHVMLMLEERTVRPTDTPSSLGLHIADIIECHIQQGTSQVKRQENNSTMDSDPNVIRIGVQGKDTKSRIIIHFRKTEPMCHLMKEFAAQKRVKLEKLKFHFDGEEIQPTDTPNALELEDGFCIDVTGL